MRHFLFLVLLGVSLPCLAQLKPQGKLLRFFPNPAITTITFEYEQAHRSDYKLQVFNLMGKKVYEANTTALRTTINLDGFFRGMYLYQLQDLSGKVIDSGKFQVNK